MILYCIQLAFPNAIVFACFEFSNGVKFFRCPLGAIVIWIIPSPAFVTFFIFHLSMTGCLHSIPCHVPYLVTISFSPKCNALCYGHMHANHDTVNAFILHYSRLIAIIFVTYLFHIGLVSETPQGGRGI